MNSAFLPIVSPLPLHRTRLQICKRRPQQYRCTPTALAKFQQKETNDSSESETPLESIIPPPALPTLTTLTGEQKQKTKTTSEQPQPDIELPSISTQGAALSEEEEGQIRAFLKSVAQEFGLIEWPSFGRVIRLTVIILLTLIIAVAALYFVDGFFYRMANIVFEGKI